VCVCVCVCVFVCVFVCVCVFDVRVVLVYMWFPDFLLVTLFPRSLLSLFFSLSFIFLPPGLGASPSSRTFAKCSTARNYRYGACRSGRCGSGASTTINEKERNGIRNECIEKKTQPSSRVGQQIQQEKVAAVAAVTIWLHSCTVGP